MKIFINVSTTGCSNVVDTCLMMIVVGSRHPLSSYRRRERAVVTRRDAKWQWVSTIRAMSSASLVALHIPRSCCPLNVSLHPCYVVVCKNPLKQCLLIVSSLFCPSYCSGNFIHYHHSIRGEIVKLILQYYLKFIAILNIIITGNNRCCLFDIVPFDPYLQTYVVVKRIQWK